MKEYKYLVVNGCSFMVGTGCDNVLQNRVSKLLSDRLKCEEINLSKGGGSNDRIFRTTYDWIQNNPHKVNQSLFIIGLTDLYRKDLYSNVRKTYTAISVAELYHGQSGGAGASIKLDMPVEDVKKYSELDLKYLTSDVPLRNSLNRQCVLLNSYIKVNDGRLIIFPSFLGKSNKSDGEKWISNTDEIERYKPGGYDSWRKFIHSYRDSYEGGHPSSKDNKVLAQQLYKYIYE